MRKGFGASVNTCETCSITARLLFFICAGKGILVFDTVGGQHFQARESSLSILHSFIHWKMVRVAQGWPLTIYYLLFHTSFFHSFVCLYFSSILLSFNHFPRSDVNECTDVIASCGLGAECINLNGSFDCRCREGFQKIKDNCAGHTTVIPVILPVYFHISQRRSGFEYRNSICHILF